MARTVEQIQNEIILVKESQPELATLSSTSRRAIWRLWTYVVAVAIAVLEQLQDVYLANIESIVARSAAASRLWIQSKMFEFQFSATNPQVVQLIDTIPQYPNVIEELRIITACAVTSITPNIVNIKVAKGSPLTALSTAELNAAQGYINTIGVAGINYTVESKVSDKLFIEAVVYYHGQYSAVIEQLVIDALDSFLENRSKTDFNGSIKVTDIELVIRGVVGVNDVILNNVKARANTVPLANATLLVSSNTLTSRIYDPVAGYVVQETTSGNTFADTLTFIPQ